MATVMHCDTRSLNYCNKGARRFCERHNLDWKHFIKHGYDESILLATNDEMAKKLIGVARQREAENGRSS